MEKTSGLWLLYCYLQALTYFLSCLSVSMQQKKSQLLGTSKTPLCFQEEKGLCFGITVKVWWKWKGPSSFLVLMILLYEHNATGISESANIIPAIHYLTYCKFSTLLDFPSKSLSQLELFSKVQHPVPWSVPISLEGFYISPVSKCF